MMTPNFIIIGAMKSGTTSLYDDLKTSTEFCLPEHKEPKILLEAQSVEEAKFLYKRHFRTKDKNIILGEASTYYMMQPLYPNISGFAKEVCGENLKIIAILRDPVDRIISHVIHDYKVGRILHCNIGKAISEDERYTKFSDYVFQLKPWITTFGKENVFCVSFNDYKHNRLKTVRSIASFIGGDPLLIKSRIDISNQSSEIRNSVIPTKYLEFYNKKFKSKTPKFISTVAKQLLSRKSIKRENHPQIRSEEKRQLQNFFENQEEELYKLIGKKFNINIEV